MLMTPCAGPAHRATLKESTSRFVVARTLLREDLSKHRPIRALGTERDYERAEQYHHHPSSKRVHCLTPLHEYPNFVSSLCLTTSGESNQRATVKTDHGSAGTIVMMRADP